MSMTCFSILIRVKYIVSTNKTHILSTFYQFIKSVHLMYKMTNKYKRKLQLKIVCNSTKITKK